MFYRFATQYADYSLPTSTYTLTDYPEVYSMTGEIYWAWDWAISSGLILGVPEDGYYHLYPSRNITRAEFASIVNRLQSYSGEW